MNSIFPSVTSIKASAPEPSVPVLINTTWSLTLYPEPASSTTISVIPPLPIEPITLIDCVAVPPFGEL